MKNSVKYILHKLLGFQNYLFVFSLFKIYTLRWDRKERGFFIFLTFIQQDTIVLDIGANIGIMTTIIARRFKNASVFAFEPMPNNMKTVKKIIHFFKLKNVSPFQIAASNSEGEMEMVMPIIHAIKMQGLSHVVHQSITEHNEGEKVTVLSTTLDSFEALMKTDKKISAIKIDIENFEFYALDGAQQLLTKHKPVVYAELWENENRQKSFDLMKSLGYEINIVEKNKLTPFRSEQHPTQNFIFIHPNA